jgi:hypothetical protein
MTDSSSPEDPDNCAGTDDAPFKGIAISDDVLVYMGARPDAFDMSFGLARPPKSRTSKRPRPR